MRQIRESWKGLFVKMKQKKFNIQKYETVDKR